MSATRAALHGTVTAAVVALRVFAAIADVIADLARRTADAIASGRGTVEDVEPKKKAAKAAA